jgi:hypothetical protein
MLRVVLERTRQGTKQSGKLSCLQFGSALKEVQESTRSAGVTSTILTIPRSHHGADDDLEANGESNIVPLEPEERAGRADDGTARI